MNEFRKGEGSYLTKRGNSYIFFLLSYLFLALAIVTVIAFFSGLSVFGNAEWSVIMLFLLASGLLGVISLVLYVIELREKATIVHSELTLPLILFVIFVNLVLSAFWITIFAHY